MLNNNVVNILMIILLNMFVVKVGILSMFIYVGWFFVKNLVFLIELEGMVLFVRRIVFMDMFIIR